MGIVLVAARIENLDDARDAEKGRIRSDQIRSIEVNDARVDSRNQRLIGNPDHDGEFMIDMY